MFTNHRVAAEICFVQKVFLFKRYLQLNIQNMCIKSDKIVVYPRAFSIIEV